MPDCIEITYRGSDSESELVDMSDFGEYDFEELHTGDTYCLIMNGVGEVACIEIGDALYSKDKGEEPTDSRITGFRLVMYPPKRLNKGDMPYGIIKKSDGGFMANSDFIDFLEKGFDDPENFTEENGNRVLDKRYIKTYLGNKNNVYVAMKNIQNNE